MENLFVFMKMDSLKLGVFLQHLKEGKVRLKRVRDRKRLVRKWVHYDCKPETIMEIIENLKEFKLSEKEFSIQEQRVIAELHGVPQGGPKKLPDYKIREMMERFDHEEEENVSKINQEREEEEEKEDDEEVDEDENNEDKKDEEDEEKMEEDNQEKMEEEEEVLQVAEKKDVELRIEKEIEQVPEVSLLTEEEVLQVEDKEQEVEEPVDIRTKTIQWKRQNYRGGKRGDFCAQMVPRIAGNYTYQGPQKTNYERRRKKRLERSRLYKTQRPGETLEECLVRHNFKE